MSSRSVWGVVGLINMGLIIDLLSTDTRLHFMVSWDDFFGFFYCFILMLMLIFGFVLSIVEACDV